MSEYRISCPKCGESIELPGRPVNSLRAKCLNCGHEGRIQGTAERAARQKKKRAAKLSQTAMQVPPADSVDGKKRRKMPWLTLAGLVLALGTAWTFRSSLATHFPELAQTIGVPADGDSVNGMLTDDKNNSLSSQAFAILKTHCADCHGDGNAEGGFDIVLDSEKLIDGYYVAEGSSATSELFARMSHDDEDLQMPPKDSVETMPTSDEIEIIRQWIDGGASVVAFNSVAENVEQPTIPVNQPTGPANELATQVKKIFKEKCYRCHGESGRVEGGFNFVMNRQKLVDSGMIVPGDSSKGTLLRRISNDSMPPRGESPRLSAEDRGVVEAWINAGAPDFNVQLNRDFITNADIFRKMEADLRSLPEFDREFTRYFTLTHLHNADVSDEEMDTYRLALAKLLNSLSRQQELFRPRPIDDAQTILRIDLRQLKWDEQTWTEIVGADPYAIQLKDADTCSVLTGCGVPSVRGDWFVHKASLPDLYHKILEIPNTLEALLEQERVDIKRNIREAVALRAGFNESGVSENNRLIERHPSTYGYFWISYDFAGNKGLQNLLSHPLGPGDREEDFRHDGGEVIFSLPNGLQAYMLVDAKGKRLDEGPIEIVKDPKQSNAHVTNGVSCISCHYAGIIPKQDEVAETVRANTNAYGTLSEEILRLYRPDEASQKQESDAKRFQRSLAEIGINEATENGEPVFHMSRRFVDSLALKLAAAEFGLEPDALIRRINSDTEIGRVLGALKVSGTIKRDRFLEVFADVAVAMGIGEHYEGHTLTPAPVPQIAKKDKDEPLKSIPANPVEPPRVTATPKKKPAGYGYEAAPGRDPDISKLLEKEMEKEKAQALKTAQPPTGPRTWRLRSGKPVVEAIPIDVDMKSGEVILVPAPREWQYRGGLLTVRSLYIVRSPQDPRAPLKIRLMDPVNHVADALRLLSDYRQADISYVMDIGKKIQAGVILDRTNPNVGGGNNAGIVWALKLNNLHPDDRDTAVSLANAPKN